MCENQRGNEKQLSMRQIELYLKDSELLDFFIFDMDLCGVITDGS